MKKLAKVSLALSLGGALVTTATFALTLDPPPGGGYPNDITALGTTALFNIHDV